jgi:protein phosphatase
LTDKVWWAIIANVAHLQPSPTAEPQTPQATVPQPVTDSTAATSAAPWPPQESASEQLEPSVPAAIAPDVPSTETLPISSLPQGEEKSPEEDAQMPVVPAAVEESLDDQDTQPVLSPAIQSSSGNDYSQEASSGVSPAAVYLDSQQRYKLLESLTPKPTVTGVETSQVKVLDCQPFQKTLLQAIIEPLPSASGRSNPASQSSALDYESWKASLPAIAQPYLALQSSLSPTLPAIHDAWLADGQAVVLLEDRSEWPLLVDRWRNEQVPTLQILYGLGQMAQLWVALEPWRMRQSLLEITNLRVDEDQMIGLQQLYKESESGELTLQDLGAMWQSLFDQSQRTQFPSLAQLLGEMRTGEVVKIEQLRSRLQAIADEIQGNTADESSIPTQGFSQSFASDTSPSESEDLPSESNEVDDAPTVILPMQLIALEDAGRTDIGRQRNHNEDFFGIQTQVNKQETPTGRSVKARGLYILCDGMGGHASGEVASAMAVETLKRYFAANWQDTLPTEDSIREAVLRANQAIYDVNQKNASSGSGRMGTTLVVVLIQETKMAIAHVGDSRLYRVTRRHGLEQVTVDHEVGQREILRGVEPAIAYSRPDAYQLTQALGPRDENFLRPDVDFMELDEDTLLILCSDGLTDNDLLENHWQSHLAPLLSSRANLDQGVSQLIDLANQHNGHDNITAVLVRAKLRPNAEQQKRF